MSSGPEARGHNGFWSVWNLAKKFGKFLYKNLPIYKEKTWQKWSSVDPHCSLVTHSAKGRFKWKNWLFIMPFCQLLSILAAFLIANCNFWLERTWLTFLKRFMTVNWPKQKKVKKFPPGIELESFCVEVRSDNHYTTKTSYERSWLMNKKPNLGVALCNQLQICMLNCKSSKRAISFQIFCNVSSCYM